MPCTCLLGDARDYGNSAPTGRLAGARAMGQRPRVRARAVLLSAALLCACQRGESGESGESGAAATDHAAAPAPAPSPSPSPAPAPSPAPSPAPVDDPAAYARDVDRICRVEELSGVATQPELN